MYTTGWVVEAKARSTVVKLQWVICSDWAAGLGCCKGASLKADSVCLFWRGSTGWAGRSGMSVSFGGLR